MCRFIADNSGQVSQQEVWEDMKTNWKACKTQNEKITHHIRFRGDMVIHIPHEYKYFGGSDIYFL